MLMAINVQMAIVGVGVGGSQSGGLFVKGELLLLIVRSI